MPAKSRFTRLDAFAKTVEDARVRTSSGGIVTIASLLVIFWLVWGEWADYRRIIVKPELVVDKGRGWSPSMLGVQTVEFANYPGGERDRDGFTSIRSLRGSPQSWTTETKDSE